MYKFIFFLSFFLSFFLLSFFLFFRFLSTEAFNWVNLVLASAQISDHCLHFLFNPYLTNSFSHLYQLLGESTFIFRGNRSVFKLCGESPLQALLNMCLYVLCSFI